MSRQLTLAGVCFLAALSTADVAVAQDARTLFQQGQSAYQLGNYEEAIDSFTRAYQLDARPALQYNLAQAYGRLGRIEEERQALELYVQGATAGGTAESDPQIVSARARITAIDERIRRTGVELHGVPSDATVRIDGSVVTLVLGEPVRLSPDSHEIVVSCDGYEDFTATVAVRAGETLDVAVRLRRAEEQTVVVQSDGRSYTGAYALMGAGGGMVVIGAVLGASALSRADGAVVDSSDADAASGLALGADIALFGGGAVAATGLIMRLVQSGSSTDVAVAPRVSRDSASLTVFGRF